MDCCCLRYLLTCHVPPPVFGSCIIGSEFCRTSLFYLIGYIIKLLIFSSILLSKVLLTYTHMLLKIGLKKLAHEIFVELQLLFGFYVHSFYLHWKWALPLIFWTNITTFLVLSDFYEKSDIETLVIWFSGSKGIKISPERRRLVHE